MKVGAMLRRVSHRIVSLFDARDVHLYGGGALVVWGVWQLGHPEIAVICAGAYLVYLGRPWR